MMDCSARPGDRQPTSRSLREAGASLTGRGGEDVEDRLLYCVTEVAVFLNVSRSKVYELLASGDQLFFKMGILN
jgi:excisionase family DNA binding protein